MDKFVILEKKDNYVKDYDVHFASDLDQAIAFVDYILNERLNQSIDQVDKDKLDNIVEVYSNIGNEIIKDEYFM